MANTKKVTKAEKKNEGKPEATAPVINENALLDNYVCPRCESSNYRVIGRYGTTHFEGVHQGKEYNRVDRFRIHCDDCDKTSVLLTRVKE